MDIFTSYRRKDFKTIQYQQYPQKNNHLHKQMVIRYYLLLNLIK
jgi:F420-0:gamma-glutamyl ligase-like protein